MQQGIIGKYLGQQYTSPWDTVAYTMIRNIGILKIGAITASNNGTILRNNLGPTFSTLLGQCCDLTQSDTGTTCVAYIVTSLWTCIITIL